MVLRGLQVFRGFFESGIGCLSGVTGLYTVLIGIKCFGA